MPRTVIKRTAMDTKTGVSTYKLLEGQPAIISGAIQLVTNQIPSSEMLFLTLEVAEETDLGIRNPKPPLTPQAPQRTSKGVENE